MNKLRETALLLLPCLGLLALAATLARPRSQAQAEPAAPVARASRAYILIQPPVPGATWSQDGAVGVSSGLHFSTPYLATRPAVRWYLNCQVEGTLGGKKRVFYSSGGHDPFGCATSSNHLSSSPLAHRMQQQFLLRRLPRGASNLVYRVEAVALAGAWAVPQEMTRGELQQARRSGRLLGMASNSMPLSPSMSSSTPSLPRRGSTLLLPFAVPTATPGEARLGPPQVL